MSCFSVEHYEKGDVIDHENPCAFVCHKSCVVMNVTSGSKVRNLIGHAVKRMQVSLQLDVHRHQLLEYALPNYCLIAVVIQQRQTFNVTLFQSQNTL